FGLARQVAEGEVADGSGTPAYMAPEQRAGELVGPWTDQYAFCLLGLEALAGRAPGAVTRCLQRGMAREPARRFPSMDALLQELEQAARPRWRPVPWLSAGAALAVAAAASAWLWREPGCRAAERALDGVWDQPARQAVRSAFLGSGGPEAGPAFDRVGVALDRYGRQYADAAQRACLAARAGPAEDEGRRTLCLTRRRQELAALVALLRAADRAVLAKAADAARALRPVSDCEDPARLRRQPRLPVDPLARQASEQVRGRIAEARALHLAGRYAEARAVYERELDKAEAIHDGALVADILFGLSACHGGMGDVRGSQPLLERAVLEAEGARHDEVAARARMDLVGLASKMDPGGDLETPSRAARASVQRLGGDPELEVLLLHELANVAGVRQDRAGELQRFQEAMDLTERSFPPDHQLQVVAANNLGSALGVAGRYREALALHERARALRVKLYGADHVDVNGSVHNQARVLVDAGRLEEALALERGVVSRWEAALGEGHPRLGRARQILAEALLRMGRAAEALPLSRSALAISEATVGTEQAEQVPLLSQLGVIEGELGAWAEAEAFHRRAIALAERLGAPLGRPSLAAALIASGETQWLQGKLEEAAASAERGRALADGLWGPHSREAQRARAVLGAALVEQGRAAEAAAALRGALAPAPEDFAPTAAPRCQALAALVEAERQLREGDGLEAAAKELLRECRPGRAHPASVALGRLALARWWKEEGGGGDRAMAAVATDALERGPPGYRRFVTP
ncbi:MAG TPA: tetratricopeptide repeat-containing protein kinase family protein, partial [Myxococcales bacterium]|nr:tetratricopeptide repeat-containing protein kinase family protein [Myxococcales bacterium]